MENIIEANNIYFLIGIRVYHEPFDGPKKRNTVPFKY